VRTSNLSKAVSSFSYRPTAATKAYKDSGNAQIQLGDCANNYLVTTVNI